MKRKHKAAKGEASTVITFPVIKAEDHKKIKIKGKECHPIFTWLKSKSLNGVSENQISWNFNKFLINKQGELVSYFPSNVKPLDETITTQIN